jgi:hypothetical protein
MDGNYPNSRGAEIEYSQGGQLAILGLWVPASMPERRLNSTAMRVRGPRTGFFLLNKEQR